MITQPPSNTMAKSNITDAFGKVNFLPNSVKTGAAAALTAKDNNPKYPHKTLKEYKT
jgi:hypothetical protein